MIEKQFLIAGINPSNAVFDPIPSYDGNWSFTMQNMRRNTKDKELWDSFYNSIYEEPLKKIFETDRILDLNVRIVSKPTNEMKGRCLTFSKGDFFVELTNILNQNIDRHGLNDNQNDERIITLLSNIKKENEELNVVYSNSFKEHAKRLKDVLDKGFDSEYFESAMKDFEPYKNEMNFEEYIKDNYSYSCKLQVGLLRLNDFFDNIIDFNKLYELFDPDIFCLLFAKIICDDSLNKENGLLDSNYGYLVFYKKMLDELLANDKDYNPEIFYVEDSTNKIIYSGRNFINDYSDLLKKYPDIAKIKLLPIEENNNNYKDITLMDKIASLSQKESRENWAFLTEDEEIKKYDINNQEEIFKELNMRISILENSGFIGRPIKGINKYSGFYGFIYPNGKVIIEKFWNNEDTFTPAQGIATYVISIDRFIKISKSPRTNLIEYMKTLPEIGIKRIFHTSINNWQRNLFKEINGTYRKEDAFDFINSLNKGEKTHEQ